MQQNNLATANNNDKTRTCEVNGKRYMVVSHFTGNKDFKKVLGDIAFKQAFTEIKNNK